MNGSAANFTKIAIHYYRAVQLLSHGAIIIENTIANAKTNKNTNICGTYYVQMQIQIQECKETICPLVVDTLALGTSIRECCGVGQQNGGFCQTEVKLGEFLHRIMTLCVLICPLRGLLDLLFRYGGGAAQKHSSSADLPFLQSTPPSSSPP